jgi:hypothetical protein
MSATGILQAATVIAKTTQTAVGSILGTEQAKHITLFGTYAKGDETGLDIVVSFQRTAAGTAHPLSVWSPTAGVYTRVDAKYRLTASANFAIQLDITAVDFLLFTQGGSNNDGTPTGTLAMSYTLGHVR